MQDLKKVYYREKELVHITGMSRATIHRLVKAGHFPAPKRITDRTTVYVVDEVHAFIDHVNAQGSKEKPMYSV